MLGTISFLKEFGRKRFWGYVEAKGRHYHFDAHDVTSGSHRVRVGVEVEFEPISSSNPHVTPKAQDVIVLPLEAEDV